MAEEYRNKKRIADLIKNFMKDKIIANLFVVKQKRPPTGDPCYFF